MASTHNKAAELLEGKTLPNGWLVLNKIGRKSYSTGGLYSACYEVSNGKRKGFLKAFDYSSASKIGDGSVDEVKNTLDAFTLERDILKLCALKRCRNIITLLDNGTTVVNEVENYPHVMYLILEYAEKGDVRDILHNPTNDITLEWKARSLHQLAKGLSQIHKIRVAHQDIKPSNIVTLASNDTRLTDFGSAVQLSKGIEELPEHLKKSYAGSWEYAPPELLYGDVSDDPVIRRIGCDLYLLGSMVAYYFTNMNMTSIIRANLQDNLHWTNPNNYGNYKQLKPYLILAYNKALEDIGAQIKDAKAREWITDSIKYLCHPDPALRGHKKTISGPGNNYELERFLTIFSQMIRYFKFVRSTI